MECAISDPSTDCEWYKNGVLLTGGAVRANANQRSLHFLSITHEDEGEYECRCGEEYTKARVVVLGMIVISVQCSQIDFLDFKFLTYFGACFDKFCKWSICRTSLLKLERGFH